MERHVQGDILGGPGVFYKRRGTQERGETDTRKQIQEEITRSLEDVDGVHQNSINSSSMFSLFFTGSLV